MARKNFRTMWFIFVSPEQFGGLGNRYIAQDGTVTNSPKAAAKFFTARAAHRFAQDKRIKLDGATQYIAQNDFHESDISAEPKPGSGPLSALLCVFPLTFEKYGERFKRKWTSLTQCLYSQLLSLLASLCSLSGSTRRKEKKIREQISQAAEPKPGASSSTRGAGSIPQVPL